MGLRVTLHVHNDVGADRNDLVFAVFPDVFQGFFHQDGCIAFALILGIYLGMDEVTLSWHKRVISKSDSLFFQN